MSTPNPNNADDPDESDNQAALASQAVNPFAGMEQNSFANNSLDPNPFELSDQQTQILGNFTEQVGTTHASSSGWRGGSYDGGAAGSFSYGGPGWKLNSHPTKEDAKAIIDTANQMGIKPQDLVCIFAQESGGDPNRRGGDGGRYFGLIQFSPDCQARYGLHDGMTISEQLPCVKKYFEERFAQAHMPLKGANLVQLYSAVLAGSPAEKYQHSADSNGTTAANSARADGSLEQHGYNLLKQWGMLDVSEETAAGLTATAKAQQAVASSQGKGNERQGKGNERPGHSNLNADLSWTG